MCKSNFIDDDAQNYLVFQTTKRYFKRVSNTDDHILSRKSKVLSDESIKPPYISTNILNFPLNYVGNEIRINLNIVL